MIATESPNAIAQLVAGISTKKSLKTINAIVAQRTETQSDLFEYRFFFAVCDAVDWSSALGGDAAKESGKVQFLAKTAKSLLSRGAFLDFFGEAFAAALNRRVWAEHFVDLLAALKLPENARVLVAAALAMARDSAVAAIGLAQLRAAIADAFRARAAVELPNGAAAAIAAFLRARFGDPPTESEIAFFVEAISAGKGYANLGSDADAKEIPLNALLRESGPIAVGALRTLFREQQTLKESEVLKCILTIIDNSAKKAPFAAALFGEENVAAPRWDVETFVKALFDVHGKKLSSERIANALATLDDSFAHFLESRKQVNALFAAMAVVRRFSAFKWSNELFQFRWQSALLKGFVLLALLEGIEGDAALLDELFPHRIVAGSVAGLNALTEIGAWTRRELLVQVFDLSPLPQIAIRLRALADSLMKNSVEALLYVLASVAPKRGASLHREILKVCLAAIFNSSLNTFGVVEAFYSLNKRLFIALAAELCDGENAALFLSKILDFAQATKTFQTLFLELSQSENHIFSISLALLAVKREFLRLENWMEASMKGGQLAWIEEFVRYLVRSVLKPLEGSPPPSRCEEILEKAQLSINNLATIFENYLFNATAYSYLLPEHIERIRGVYDQLTRYYPELNQASVQQPDVKANEILEKVYFEAYPLEEFVETVARLRQSTRNRDQEILSCILINIMNEYRYFKHFPEKELQITADIYGQLIKHRIVDGRTLAIFLKGLTDCLDVDGNMFAFGLRGLRHFVLDTDLCLGAETYRQLFNNARLRERHRDLLLELAQRLQASGRPELVPTEQLRLLARTAQPAEPAIASRTLMEHVARLYREATRDEETSAADCEALNAFFATLEPVRGESRLAALDQLLLGRGLARRFAYCLVYQRVPVEGAMHGCYARLVFKSSVAGLYSLVYRTSMAMLDSVVDFVNAKEQLQNEEKAYMKLCGKWGGVITFALNQPIQLRHLNLKQKVLEAVERKKLYNVVVFLCSLLSAVEDSEVFTPRVPCINALFDALREIYPLPFLHQTARVFIEVLNNDLKVKNADIHEFRWLATRRAAEARGRRLGPADTAAMVRIDLGRLAERDVAERLHVDLREVVCAAIESALFDIRSAIVSRTLKNTLETVRALVLKDFCGESDETRLLAAAQTMITNLTWNLALFTCREPMRVKMLEKLDNLLRVQSELDEPTRRATKEALVAANLDFALACLKKVVIEVSTQEVARDPELQEEARRRRQAREAKTRFSHETFRRLQRELPKMLRPRADARELDCVAIYNAAIGGEAEGVARESEAAPANEERIGDLAREVENELANLSVDEQPRFVARLLAALTQMLQQSRNAESTATKIAQIFFNLFESHRALTIDVFLVCRRFHATLGRTLIQWAFEGELSAELIAALLRTALVEPNELDRRFAAALGECGERALSAVVDFYARTLGEERLIDFDALPLSARALCAAARDGRGDALSTDRRAFLFAMTESGDERIPSPRIAALRSVLSSAVESLFRVRDEALFRLCADFLDRRLSARDEPSADRALDALFAGAPIDFRAFAVYLTDIAINATVRGYALVDAVARALSAAVRRADNALRGQTFENALFGVAAAIAKAHSLSAPFNARAFFRFLRAFVESGEAIDDFRRKKAFIEILELLSPTKYSRFAFCWLSLIAARSLLSTLRSDESAVYSPLLFALIDFCRTAFAFDALTSQRTRLLYIGILRYFLVLQNDYRDFLAANAFALVERLPTQFRQLRNVILSVCADGRAPNPFLAAAVEPRPSAEDANAERVAAALGVIGQLDAALECKGGDAREIAAALRTSDGRPRVAAVRAAVRVMPRIAARAQRREQSVELFVKLLCVGGDELNEEILRAIFDSLTDPTDSTLYFVQLLLSLAERCDERVSEQLLRQMFERLIVQKPHPWGLLHFFNRALTGSAALRRRAPPVDELLRLAAECVQINNFDVCFG